ncbi:MAG: type VI secretion system tip protein VgrG [Candidatus Accumulibacter sp.]|jgi:type VI secretion system VgrG family protein|nr:type VI secretion system tip protein VgrG [Accumulibacter sp.]
MSTPTPHTELFRFSSQALPEETMHVLRFTGEEGVNELFNFTIEIVSPNPGLDTGKLLSDRAVFSILREDGSKAVFSGYPARVEQGGAFNGYSYYTVELRPALWKMTRIVQSCIFLDQTLKDTVQELLRSQAFFTFPHRFDFTRMDYPRREFAMQYEESIYNYLLWRLEDQGAYYYFSQTETEDTLHFADSPISHRPQELASVLRYSPPTGLEGDRIGEVLTSFTLSQSQLPAQVILRSYNWRNPNKPIVGAAPVSGDGLGDVYLTGEDVESDAEALRLAKIRAEELVCHAKRFHGAGSVPGIRPGYTFRLTEHYNRAFNREYLVTNVLHEGSQESFINLGLGIPLENLKDHLFYRNRFTCIEAGVPYRPQRQSPRTKISGVIHAFIDGASEGSRPEIDAMGRYKLMFPFDVSGRREGKASCWIRRAQEQVGKNSGASFPLLPGTEVLVSFSDGNPDRPYITGALANAETGALTGSGNSNFSGISTPGGSSLVFKDSGEKQGLGMIIPSGSGIVMGAGSLPAGSKDSFYWMDSSAMSTNFSTLSQNMSSSFKVTQLAGGVPWNKYFTLVGGAMAGTFGAVASSLRGSSNEISESEDWGLEMAKSTSLLLQSIGDFVTAWKVGGAATSTPYAYSVTATEDAGKSILQAYPDTGQLVAGLVFDLIAKAGSLTAASAGIVDAFDPDTEKDRNLAADKDVADAQTALDTAKEDENKVNSDASATQAAKDAAKVKRIKADLALKTAKTKKEAILSYKTQSIGKLLPELLALVLMTTSNIRTIYNAGGSKGKWGGILLNAPESNINAVANNAIGLHSGHGILIESGNRLQRMLENLYDKVAKERWGSKDVKDLNVFSLGKLFNFGYSDALENTISQNEIQSRDLSFLADSTSVRYTDAEYLIESIDEIRKSFAKKHIIVAKANDGESTIVVQNTNNNWPGENGPQKPDGFGGIFLTTKGSNHKIIRIDANKFSLSIDDDSVEIKKKDGGKPSVKITGTDIVLMQSNDVTVTLASDAATIKGKTSTATLKEGTIELKTTPDKYVIGKIEINANAIKNTTGSLDIQGGAIKIIG